VNKYLVKAYVVDVDEEDGETKFYICDDEETDGMELNEYCVRMGVDVVNVIGYNGLILFQRHNVADFARDLETKERISG